MDRLHNGMKTHRTIMETAKLTDFLYSFNFYLKTGNISKAHYLIEHLNKSSECVLTTVFQNV